MSIFQHICGRSKKEDPNVTPIQAIERLSSTTDVLLKKQEHLKAQIETEQGNAIRLSKQGNKLKATMAMEKKKKYQKALVQVDGTLTTLESQQEALQNVSNNMEVFKAVEQGANALKTANQGAGADTINESKDNMDEHLYSCSVQRNKFRKRIFQRISKAVRMRVRVIFRRNGTKPDEQFSIEDEISAVISSPALRASDGISEEDLLAELKDLAAEEDNQAVIRNGPLPNVPVASTSNKRNGKD